MSQTAGEHAGDGPDRRLLLVLAAGAMGAAGTYQFVWSSISAAVAGRTGATGATLGTVFTAAIVGQTLAQIPAGRIRDRRGPGNLLIVAAALLAAGYVGTALADRILVIGAAYAVGGAGAGVAYTVAVNTPVKWFDDRRALATGVVTVAYAGVSVALIPLVRQGIDDRFRATMLGLAAVVGVVTLAAAAVVRDPAHLTATTAADGGRDDRPTSDADADEGATGTTRAEDDTGAGTVASEAATAPAYTWRETLRTWQFWLLYAVLLVINGVGLMFIGNAVGLATALDLSEASATAAASTVALADSLGLVVVGGLADRFGRERTVAVSITLAGVALGGAVLAGEAASGVGFVVLLGVAAGLRSPVFAVFPGLIGDYYGTQYSSENYALLYSAKVPGAVVGGTATGALVGAVGWIPSFVGGAVVLTLAGVATALVRPVRR